MVVGLHRRVGPRRPRRGHAEFYVVRTPGFELSDAEWTDDERVDILASRWWTAEELDATDEPFEPAELPQLVRQHRVV